MQKVRQYSIRARPKADPYEVPKSEKLAPPVEVIATHR